MGQFAIVDGELQVPMSPAAMNMACGSSEVMSLEHEFLQGLSTIQATRMQATTIPQKLLLTLKSGDVWEFNRFIDPIAGGVPGVAKFVYVNSQRAPCSASAGQSMCYQIRMNSQDPWQL